MKNHPDFCSGKDFAMSDKKNVYLIDYENVNEDGLEGSNKLTKNDYVNIFTSKNAPYFSIKTLVNFNNTNLYFHEVPAGKQSVDMNLASFFGYLVAQNDASAIKYIIVSKDTDYDNVITFWRNKRAINIVRQERIKTDTQPVKPAPAPAPQEPSELHKSLTKGGLNADTISYVVSLAEANIKKKDVKTIVYLSLVKKYGQQDGLKIYNLIKKQL